VDGFKNHIIPHLSRKKTSKEMWDALVNLYQSNNQSRKMLLREKLKSMKIAKEDSWVTYLTKFPQIIDEMASLGEAVGQPSMARGKP